MKLGYFVCLGLIGCSATPDNEFYLRVLDGQGEISSERGPQVGLEGSGEGEVCAVRGANLHLVPEGMELALGHQGCRVKLPSRPPPK